MEFPDQAPAVDAEEIVAPVAADTAEQVAEPVAEDVAAEVVEPVAELVEPVTEEPAVEQVAEAAPAAESDAPIEPVAENLVDGLIDGDTPVPMFHPDGGTCDAYETDGEGHLIVPAVDVPAMLSHGFVVVGGDE